MSWLGVSRLGLSRLGAWARQGPPEPPLLAAPRRDAVIAAVAAALTAAAFIAAADNAVLAHIQHLDDAWLRLMVSGRTAPVTEIAKVFNVLGLVYVTFPVRVAVIGYLGFRRRWWRLAAFGSAVLLSEILIGTLKGAYDRVRPPGSLVATSGASFPSGHSIAASVTVVAMVIVLVSPGRHRVAWAAGAVSFAVLMAASRAYLGAHWLSDAIAGLLLGTSCALLAAVAVDQVQRWRTRPAVPVAAARSIPSGDRR